MESVESKITSKGQISIPASVRRKLGLKPGSRIEWREQGDDVIVRRAFSHTSQDIHDAVFKNHPQRISTEGMDQGIATLLRKRHARD